MVSQLKILDWSDRAVLDSVASGVFDEAVEPRLLEEFLRDERHHLAVAMQEKITVNPLSLARKDDLAYAAYR